MGLEINGTNNIIKNSLITTVSNDIATAQINTTILLTVGYPYADEDTVNITYTYLNGSQDTEVTTIKKFKTDYTVTDIGTGLRWYLSFGISKPSNVTISVSAGFPITVQNDTTVQGDLIVSNVIDVNGPVKIPVFKENGFLNVYLEQQHCTHFKAGNCDEGLVYNFWVKGSELPKNYFYIIKLRKNSTTFLGFFYYDESIDNDHSYYMVLPTISSDGSEKYIQLQQINYNWNEGFYFGLFYGSNFGQSQVDTDGNQSAEIYQLPLQLNINGWYNTQF